MFFQCMAKAGIRSWVQIQPGNKKKMLSVTFWFYPEEFCWHSVCTHKVWGTLPSVQMHFGPECSNKVKRSLEFITEKRLLLWDISGIKPPVTAGLHNLHCSLRFHSCKGSSSSRRQELSSLQSCTAAPRQEGFCSFCLILGREGGRGAGLVHIILPRTNELGLNGPVGLRWPGLDKTFPLPVLVWIKVIRRTHLLNDVTIIYLFKKQLLPYR